MESSGDLFRRAWAKLNAVRSNLQDGYVDEQSFFDTFDQALSLLQEAGENVNEWRWSPGSVGNIDAGEFRARIDEIRGYFELVQSNTQIGFRK